MSKNLVPTVHHYLPNYRSANVSDTDTSSPKDGSHLETFSSAWLSSKPSLVPISTVSYRLPPSQPPKISPCPNLNPLFSSPPSVAVYLGALATSGTSLPSAIGALIGYVGIFLPGLILHTSVIGIWKTLRKHHWVTSLLRGVNASAVGLVYTAVYRLWKIGYMNPKFAGGSSLDSDPWLVVIAATSFAGGMWFKIPAPAAILLGGVMGLVWYGVIR